MSETLTKKELADVFRAALEAPLTGKDILFRVANALDPPEPAKPRFKRGDWVCDEGGIGPRLCLSETMKLSLSWDAQAIVEIYRATLTDLTEWCKRAPGDAAGVLWHIGRIIAGEEPQ